MDTLDKVLGFLKENNVQIDIGLSSKEIQKIELDFHITFPAHIKALFSRGLPISLGFYNWRDKSTSNVKTIRTMLNYPYDCIENEIDAIEWSDNWGIEPNSIQQRQKEILFRLKQAPRLLPVFAHRYTPMDGLHYPVFSIHGIDIINYGANIYDYFLIEFKKEFRKTLLPSNLSTLPYVNFWSDLL